MKVILLMSGFVVSAFIYAYLWHMVLFKNVYKELDIYDREKPILPISFLTTFIQGAIFTILFHHFDIDFTEILKGTYLGLLLGLFEFCSSVLALVVMQKRNNKRWLN